MASETVAATDVDSVLSRPNPYQRAMISRDPSDLPVIEPIAMHDSGDIWTVRTSLKLLELQ
jgi:hypothetical protein